MVMFRQPLGRFPVSFLGMGEQLGLLPRHRLGLKQQIPISLLVGQQISGQEVTGRQQT